MEPFPLLLQNELNIISGSFGLFEVMRFRTASHRTKCKPKCGRKFNSNRPLSFYLIFLLITKTNGKNDWNQKIKHDYWKLWHNLCIRITSNPPSPLTAQTMKFYAYINLVLIKNVSSIDRARYCKSFRDSHAVFYIYFNEM